MAKKRRSNQTLSKYDGITEKKLTAFLMRFKGHTYEEIAKETEYNIYYLQRCFSKEGEWFEEYQTWAAERVDDFNDQIARAFTAQALESFQQIINLSRGKAFLTAVDDTGKEVKIPLKVTDRTMLDASKDILDRAGFKPPDRLEVDETPPEDVAERMLKAMEAAKQKKAKKRSTKKNE